VIGDMARKEDVRQFGALPFHFKSGRPHIYLVTSRGSGRWIIPKGNPIRGLDPHKVAAREALEEAGLVGWIHRKCIGTFKHSRNRRAGSVCRVDVYPLEVDRQLRSWAEADQRSVAQCDLQTALSLVTSSSLSNLIKRIVERKRRPSRRMKRRTESF
jgi:ADP-ribose pyrophosphatase YjhB (NUDIX family)